MARSFYDVVIVYLSNEFRGGGIMLFVGYGAVCVRPC